MNTESRPREPAAGGGARDPGPAADGPAGPGPSARRPHARLRRLGRHLLLSEYFVLYLSILYMLALGPFLPQLFAAQNLADMVSNIWPLLVVAIGQNFVLITAGIDLSQTSNMALTSVIGAVLIVTSCDPVLFSKCPLWGTFLTEHGGPLAGMALGVPIAILIMLVIGSLIGWVNGVAVARFKMPAFMVTLTTMMFFSAVAIYLPKSENIQNLPHAFNVLGKGRIGPVPIPLLVGAGVAVGAHLLLSRTLFGRRLYAVGTNPVASTISGIPTARIITRAYVLAGFCAALASVLYSARLEMGRPTLARTQFIDIVGANVIAGVSLSGGKGKITWTLFGVIFFVLLANTLNLLDLPFYSIDIVKGLVIFGAAFLDVLRTRAAAQGH
ncbi:MAG TPA: ABC transporter permease [Anaeromyxobacter sp.]|nr:ABC transporter permease [Anaeromyxobacter sp.]